MAIGEWLSINAIKAHEWTCGFCGKLVGGSVGYYRSPHKGRGLNPEEINGPVFRILICPNCSKPTFFTDDLQSPGAKFGRPIKFVPDDLSKLYDQARDCISVSASVPAVLAARTILMHIAVELKADEGKPFEYYVDYLVAGGFVPPNAKTWIDHVRRKGNDATHRVALLGREDAEKVLRFVEMILLFLYEYPNSP